MNPIKTINGRGLPLLIDDVDTDRIIPARFLICVTFDGLGDHAFEDERRDANFPMNNPKYKGATVILSAKNFGCGSSREHAPQSLKRAGFTAVIAESFAEIFFGNSLTLGLACLTMPKADIVALSKAVEATPNAEIKMSLETMTAEFGGVQYKFTMPEIAREALMKGTYDLLSELLQNKAKIEAMAAELPY